MRLFVSCSDTDRLNDLWRKTWVLGWFCQEDRGDDSAPGGWIYEDAHWVAGHLPHTYGPPGLVVLESRRHFLDASKMTSEEAATFAVVLGRLTAAIKQTVGAERVYTWSSMAQFPHMHVWLMPWKPDKPEGPAFLSAIDTFKCRREEAQQTATELRALLRHTSPV